MNETPFSLPTPAPGSPPIAGTLVPILLSRLPADWPRRNRALPAIVNGTPSLLVARPDILAPLQEAQLAIGQPLHPVSISPGDLDHLLALAIGQPAPPADGATRIASPDLAAPPALPADPIAAPPPPASSAPVPEALNRLLADAVRRRASDVHFEPLEEGLRVRFRIDGTLYEVPAPPRDLADAIVSRIKVMARMDIAERRLPQDGMTQFHTDGRTIDIRVSTIPVSDGERVVMRLLDRDNAWLPLDGLGMGETVRHAFLDVISRPHGLVVVSGPTGSGKTTTLYSALSTLDSARRNILTVEDPVEYRLPSIGQIQVKPKIGLTFAAGLRHILRQDPDVILVGETRDSETAEIAIRAALTGHLVFTTLHTNDAASAVARLTDMGVEDYLLASCLRGVLAQRLVRRLCPHCSRPAAPNPDHLPSPSETSILNALPPAADLREPVGCPHCIEGHRGRIGLFEFMGVGKDVAEAIRQGAIDADSLRDAATDVNGLHSLHEDAIAKVATGIVDLAEAAAVLQT